MPRRPIVISLLSLLPLALLSGCTVARYYNGVPLRGDTAKIVQGTSTRTDVLREFGAPTQIMHQTNGDAFVYTYLRWNYASFQLRDPITGTTWFTYTRQFENRDRLLVVFDFAGVVRDIAVDNHVHEMPTL
jgi:outer membrane protein assembly factor BamE (lipoprotein component of BamABCDE complex)